MIMVRQMRVFLSFDIEEFDVPKEYDSSYNVDRDGMKISAYGTSRILDILNKENVKATFFCTAKFATIAPELIIRIHKEGHEVASHGYDHWSRTDNGPMRSKIILEGITGEKVYGYRQPRMDKVDCLNLVVNEYKYNASLNPTFIPGRYMNLFEPRKPFYRNDILNIPSSVTPILRIPLFWLSLHLFPLWMYKILCRWALYVDNILSLYFHPWEFYPLSNLTNTRVPKLISINSGEIMSSRLSEVIKMLKRKNCQFLTYKEYLTNHD